jgi:hypothetical protein
MAVSFQIVDSDHQSQIVAGQSIMTYAKAAVACPSTSSGRTAAWYFSSFVGYFFALQGEKITYKG